MSTTPKQTGSSKRSRKTMQAPQSIGRELLEIKRSQLAEILCDAFDDGLAIVDETGRYQFVNEAYRNIHAGLDDLIKIGSSYDGVLREGLKREFWNLDGTSKEDWLSEHAFTPGAIRREHWMSLADGRWTLRRSFRHDSGRTLEICSDLTRLKAKEDELNEALRRAELAEQKARLALQAEEVRKQQEELLSKLNHWLHSCKCFSELNSVVLSFITRLMPNSSGVLYTYNNSRDVLVPSCSWPSNDGLTEIKPNDCWGLRQGHSYHYGRKGLRFECEHTKVDGVPQHDEHSHYFCIPILAHGETVGLLHVCPDNAGMHSSEEQYHWFNLASKCAAQISLAISNLKMSQELQDRSTKDPLTGLFNRRYFTERCSREISRIKQGSRDSSLIFLDVDHFKTFNDKFGHDAGDVVLKEFARVLTDHFREKDVVARIGGEEFAVLMVGSTLAVARQRAEELLSKVELMEVRYGNETLPSITTSAGVIEIPTSTECYADIACTADKALYDAKKSGRNRVCS